MATELRCEDVRVELREAFLARRAPGASARRHVDACDACSRERAALLRLERDLAREPQADPSDAHFARTLALARNALREVPVARTPSPAPAPVPAGYGRELSRLLSGTVASLPLVLLWNALVLVAGEALLSEWVSVAVLRTLGIAYGVAVGSWLALLYGSLPFVAHRRAARRAEVPA